MEVAKRREEVDNETVSERRDEHLETGAQNMSPLTKNNSVNGSRMNTTVSSSFFSRESFTPITSPYFNSATNTPSTENRERERPTKQFKREQQQQSGTSEPPRPMKKFQNYVDYDLSKIKDSRGGFMFEEEESDAGEYGKKEKKRKWEPVFEEDPCESWSMDMSENPKCAECKVSIDLDYQIKKNFGVLVCKKCKKNLPDKYSLLTKTEVKEDYLLTDEEMRDSEVLPHWLKPNPRKVTWSNMMLYLRVQVEEFAFRKWGGEEGLDREYERRQAEKLKKKDKKFKAKVADLRKYTRTDELEKSRNREHKHEFGLSVPDSETGITKQTCSVCGLQIEVEEF